MDRISGFIVWICKRFNREQIEKIINGLVQALSDSNSEIKDRDQFKEEHPSYRDFHVDPNEPLKEKPGIKKKRRKATR